MSKFDAFTDDELFDLEQGEKYQSHTGILDQLSAELDRREWENAAAIAKEKNAASS